MQSVARSDTCQPHKDDGSNCQILVLHTTMRDHTDQLLLKSPFGGLTWLQSTSFAVLSSILPTRTECTSLRLNNAW